MGPREFDPVSLGRAEFAAWVAYYRRDWRQVVVAAVRMVRLGFGLPWPWAVYGAMLTAAAMRRWAPYPNNDPAGARHLMQRFYALLAKRGNLRIDAARAAELEIAWWRVHRVHQREDGVSEADLVDALVNLYAYVYGADRGAVREAAERRTLAMRLSDEWHRGGCAPTDPRLGPERRALVASYAALLAAVRRRGQSRC